MARWADKHPDLVAEIRAYLASRHPDLDLRIEDGRVSIRGSFAIADGEGVVDRFQVVICIPDDFPDGLPTLEEVGGRIPRESKRHVEPSGLACLTVPEDWYFLSQDRSFGAFMEGPIKNFLVSQSTFELTGEWPFGERPHGFEGLVQGYSERFGSTDLAVIRNYLRYLALKSPKGHWDCPCGSGKRIRQCSHQEQLMVLRSSLPPKIADRALKRFETKGATVTVSTAN